MPDAITGVVIYRQGLDVASVCAPVDMEAPAVEAALPPASDTGLVWRLSEDPTFTGGQPNPCPCNLDATRRHWLMEC